MLPRHALLAAGLAGALALPAVADAGFPAPRSTLISPGASIGGVKLNSSYKNAHAAWGGGGACQVKVDCVYYAGSGKVAPTTSPQAMFSVLGGKVYRIQLQAAALGQGTTHPLDAYKTVKGIGLGSTKAQLLKAYPKATNNPTSPDYYTLKGKGTIFTSFVLTKGHVATIIVQAYPVG